MEDRIKELIEFHKSAKEETRYLISVLKGTEDEQYNNDIEKHQIEYDLRSSFLNQLQDLL